MTERIPPVSVFPSAPSAPPRVTTMDALVRGARLFDEGAFFAAHEAWEKPWLDETDEKVRRLLQGLIQVAAAFHKLFVTGSVEPAQRLLAKGLAKLDACPASLIGVDVAAFRDAAREWASQLAAGRIDRAAIPKMRMTADAP
jgi:predicted metal-dependent hydrolase